MINVSDSCVVVVVIVMFRKLFKGKYICNIIYAYDLDRQLKISKWGGGRKNSIFVKINTRERERKKN